MISKSQINETQEEIGYESVKNKFISVNGLFFLGYIVDLKLLKALEPCRREEVALLGAGGRKILRKWNPTYPEWARRHGKTGVVELKVWVLPSGEVRNVEVYRSSGWPTLDRCAIGAAKKWRFEPIEEQKIQWG